MKAFFAFALLIICGSAYGADGETGDKTDQILKQLTEISKNIDTMKKDSEARMGKTENDLLQLRADFVELKKGIDDLKPNKVAGKEPLPPVKQVQQVQPADNGSKAESTVFISNVWGATARIYVNDKLYLVPSGSSKTVQVAPGKVTYRCLDIPNHPIQERTVEAGEVFRLNITPQTSTVVSDLPPVPYYSQVYSYPPVYASPVYYQPVYYQSSYSPLTSRLSCR